MHLELPDMGGDLGWYLALVLLLLETNWSLAYISLSYPRSAETGTKKHRYLQSMSPEKEVGRREPARSDLVSLLSRTEISDTPTLSSYPWL